MTLAVALTAARLRSMPVAQFGIRFRVRTVSDRAALLDQPQAAWRWSTGTGSLLTERTSAAAPR